MPRRFFALFALMAMAVASTDAHAVVGHYYFLQTGGSDAGRGRIDRLNADGTGRTTIADIDPAPFGLIEAWHGFATDGDYFYLLQNNGGSDPGIGRIDRINMDGTGRTTIVDIDPAPFGLIEAWHGFATDGDYFYLLQNNGGSDPGIGRIDRINLDGTGRTTLLDVDPFPFNQIESWHGFAVSAAVPEPATALLAGLGAAGLLLRRRRSA